ncbi:hypothetical protein LCGC14_0312520 [marine sediment metagenome]|uniref:HTH arsR-type domain-containing protein n=1 Tax=marine sediment metagenome TaxID=412755 RepID=A0A0F9TLW6_9ZZZZ|nr:ArsR family transcriptional regulator [Phycisphaerae bacterium]HDZ44804.1 ArsR family transcriptional regulator [Phycisphaerae bacterium]
MREYLSITKALSDESRVRIVLFLSAGELCVCQIIELLALAPSTVSKHMAILHQARLVETRKQGRWVYYRLPDAAGPLAGGAIRWARESLAKDKQVRIDAKAAKAVRKADKEELCARYGRS